jgi:hypothetical protein
MRFMRPSLTIAALAAAYALAAGAASATTVITLTDGQLSGTFGSATMNGEMTLSKSGETFDYTIVEDNGGTDYTYDFNSLSDSGEPSQIPPTPCIIAGCTGPTPNGPVEFSLPFDFEEPIPLGGGVATLQFRDGVYDYSGTGIQTEVVTPDAPEPATWAIMLLGVGMTGAGLRITRRKAAAAMATG